MTAVTTAMFYSRLLYTTDIYNNNLAFSVIKNHQDDHFFSQSLRIIFECAALGYLHG